MRPLRIALALALALTAGPALAHGGGQGAAAWTLDPWVLAPLALGLANYIAGWLRLSRRSGPGLGLLRRRGALFALGWAVLVAAVVSPLHALGEVSFTAHMIEHELLMLAAAPLLVLSRPLAVMLWAFPLKVRQGLGALTHQAWIGGLWRSLTEPLTATLLQASALWLWHAPGLFDLALSGMGWHIAQHLCFLASALLFWTAMLDPRRHRGVAALCLFATSVVSGALGALMAFAQSPWYLGYAQLGMAPYGLTPLADQQLAGLLMWIPGGVVHAGAALAMIAAVLRAPEGGGDAVES